MSENYPSAKRNTWHMFKVIIGQILKSQ